MNDIKMGCCIFLSYNKLTACNFGYNKIRIESLTGLYLVDQILSHHLIVSPIVL